jgi:hypothetical protein
MVSTSSVGRCGQQTRIGTSHFKDSEISAAREMRIDSRLDSRWLSPAEFAGGSTAFHSVRASIPKDIGISDQGRGQA